MGQQFNTESLKKTGTIIRMQSAYAIHTGVYAVALLDETKKEAVPPVAKVQTSSQDFQDALDYIKNFSLKERFFIAQKIHDEWKIILNGIVVGQLQTIRSNEHIELYTATPKKLTLAILREQEIVNMTLQKTKDICGYYNNEIYTCEEIWKQANAAIQCLRNTLQYMVH